MIKRIVENNIFLIEVFLKKISCKTPMKLSQPEHAIRHPN